MPVQLLLQDLSFVVHQWVTQIRVYFLAVHCVSALILLPSRHSRLFMYESRIEGQIAAKETRNENSV